MGGSATTKTLITTPQKKGTRIKEKLERETKLTIAQHVE
jgi:hypothetical protein